LASRVRSTARALGDCARTNERSANATRSRPRFFLFDV